MKFSALSISWARPTAIAWMVLAGVGVTVVACSGDDDNSTTVTTTADGGATVTKSIGASGGTITAADGTTISIPAGALGGTQTISITPGTTAAISSAITTAGTPYIFGPEGLQFSAPVTLTLDVDPSEIPSGKTESDLVVYTAPVGTMNFTSLPATIVDSTHISAQTTHFSIFVAGVGGANLDAGTSSVVDGGSISADAGGDDDDGSVADATTTSSTDSGGVGTSSDGGSTSSNADAGPPPAPIVLATGQGGPKSIAVDGTSVYWVNTSSGTVQKVALDGTSPVTLDTGETRPFGIVVDAANVYWSSVVEHTPPNFPIDNGTIFSEPLAGGTTPTVVYQNGGDDFGALALHGTTLFSTDLSGAFAVSTSGGTAIKFSTAETFAQTDVPNITADGTNAYWVTASTSGGGEGGTTGPSGLVRTAAYPTPATPSTLGTTDQGENYAVTNDGTNVYWSNSLGTINSMPKAGGAVTVIATSPLTETFDGGSPSQDAAAEASSTTTVANAIYGIAVDGTYVYWTTTGGTLNAVPKTGGAVRVLASETNGNYYGIALDTNNVYWTAASDTAGRILKTVKP